MKKILYLLSAVCLSFFVIMAVGCASTPEQPADDLSASYIASSDFTPLQEAVLDGDYREAARLLDENPECIDEPAGFDAETADVSGEDVPVEGATALHLALICRNEEMVRLLVERGADLYAEDADGWDAVVYGAAFSSVSCLEILLEEEDGLLTRRRYGYNSTPLHCAAKYNDADMVRYLVEECGMDIKDQDDDGDTPLDYARMEENTDVEEYIESADGRAGSSIIVFSDFTPLQQAVLDGDCREAARLLDENPECIDEPAGFDAETADVSGEDVPVEGATALHLALVSRNERMVRLLVERGADLYAEDADGWDAVVYGAAFSSVPCLEILLEEEDGLLTRRRYGYNSTPLHWAAKYNDADMVRYLVEECGMDIQDQDDDGDTPLDYALMNENTAVEEYIESADGRAGSSIIVFSDFTPLQQAVIAGDYREAARLLDENPECIDEPAGFDAETADVSGEDVPVEGATALHLALICRNEEMVRLLVERGADLYAEDVEGWDAVVYGAAFSSVPCLEILLEEEDGLLTRRRYGYNSTPLHCAAMYNDADMVRYLVEECGMDIQDQDDDGDTPLDYARMEENTAVEEYIELSGFYVYFTPLQQAVIAGDYGEAARLLDENPECIDEPAGSGAETADVFGEGVPVGEATALHLALVSRNERMVRLLVERGADLYAEDADGFDVALYGAAFSSVPCLEILLEEEDGLLTRRRYWYNSTSLHCAAMYNDVDMVRYLVEECGMDIQAQDDDGDTPLDYARMEENTAVEEYIESAGGLRNRR